MSSPLELSTLVLVLVAVGELLSSCETPQNSNFGATQTLHGHKEKWDWLAWFACVSSYGFVIALRDTSKWVKKGTQWSPASHQSYRRCKLSADGQCCSPSQYREECQA